MEIEIKINNKLQEDKVIFEVKEITDQISNLIDIIKNSKQHKISVNLDEETYFINEDDIDAAYSNEGKVFIKTLDKEFVCKERLYELEKILSPSSFIRISNSEIINLDKVKSINTKLTGTIVITFYSGYKTYSSRRYIKKIKEALDI